MRLNTKPSPYSVKTAELDYELGVAAAIQSAYESLPAERPTGVVTIDGIKHEADIDVVRMLKAILKAGVCRFPQRAAACRKVFLGALHSATKEEFLASFDEGVPDEFVKEVYRAVKEAWAK